MRAIYIAKGSPLLPPDFVSLFDDLASSSLDVFFDPSRGTMNLPGLTLGISLTKILLCFYFSFFKIFYWFQISLCAFSVIFLLKLSNLDDECYKD